MTNDLSAKMALKTDAALREYVTGHYQYREEAVLAALAELRARGQPAPEEEALRPGLEAGAAARRSQEAALAETVAAADPAADPAAEPTDAALAARPALYSPTLIVLFSVFINMLAGGVLLGLNLGRLGRWRALLALVAFLVGYLFLNRLALQWALPRFGLRAFTWFAPLLNLPPVLAYLLWFWPRYVGRGPFRSRPWLPPLLVCVVLALGAQQLLSRFIQQQSPQVRQQLEQLLPR